jgi:ribosomal protein S18 acetylase RimI-like enzyme
LREAGLQRIGPAIILPGAVEDDVLIRRATPGELPEVAKLGAALARQHHGFDPQRFMNIEAPEEGYLWWFRKELRRRGAVILVAVEHDAVLGYAYGTLEGRDWNALRDPCGALNDLYVAAPARRRGIARRLTQAMLAELRALGAPRVVLMSAAVNREAQSFFAKQGFRPTMVEMTQEL